MGFLAPYRVVHGWPILPEGYVLGQVSGVGVDSHEHVFVFHRADHAGEKKSGPIESPVVMCFDGPAGKLLDSWGANAFLVPHGLRVDDRDNIWVTDVDLHQVFKFSHDGTLRMSLGVAGTPGWDHQHFNKPTDVALAHDGSFYVSDGYGNRRIAKFSHEGRFLLEWGRAGDKPGEFNEVHNVVIDREGRVYVTDRINRRIQVFTGDGKFIYEWESEALGCPWALAYGADDFLYMVDGGDLSGCLPGRGRISRLGLDGNILEQWSSFGNYDGQLFWGHDIAVGKSGDVYVGEVNHGMRVQKFSRSEQEFLFLPRQG
ncbi:MAG: peptidyl-alpha-hydroxyglycine alpha-amidating lyase family protein [Terriglobia bacterium]|jgi:peptidylamidoglycolate lyase